ncbi:hypothetical protein TEA_000409 [Camellia sinensis var. sinensis]|uniref:Uncharacterized protein n=1 Tax=Camellia sinensis var. sinensis TaxID=542762 RepID=A0A4S4E8A1_CAMSN|nr:hypothetical protein TEA_000409 [Camellia sinensis var. sinensis]
MGKKLRSKRGSSSKIPLKEFHSSLVKKKLGPNSSNLANDKNQSNIDYMQRQLELEFEHDDFDIEETYCDAPEAYNAMVGSSVCQGSSSEQGLGKTTVPKPMGDIETATKGSAPTTNVQDYNEAKGHAQVRMSCVEGLVDVASMDSQTEAEMVQSHSSNGLGQAFRIKRRHSEERRIKGARARKKTCVTVCGVSELDACSDACARTVYVNQHQVPNWNDICLRRCQSECLKLCLFMVFIPFSKPDMDCCVLLHASVELHINFMILATDCFTLGQLVVFLFL